jgi:polyphosphate kinase
MSKLSRNEIKHIDKMQEALEILKQPKFHNVGEYGRYIKSLSSPTLEQKAIIVYSIIDMIESQKQAWGEMNNDKLMAILKPIGDETGIPLQDMLRTLMMLLVDTDLFVKTSVAFRGLFIANQPT